MTCLFCNQHMKNGSGFTMHLRHKHPDRVVDVNNYLAANLGKGFEDAMEFLTTKPATAATTVGGIVFNLKSYDAGYGVAYPGANKPVDELLTLAYTNLKEQIAQGEAKLAELTQLREKLTRDYDKLHQLEQIIKPVEHAKPGDHTLVPEAAVANEVA